MGEFPAFEKIPRLHKPVVITEKIDGTNALIEITEHPRDEFVRQNPGCFDMVDGEFTYKSDYTVIDWGDGIERWLRAGSRKRWIGDASGDNFGFAAWVREHAEELTLLGPGLHYGEWYGSGIQRNYGLTEKRFALFNSDRWADRESRPGCCDVVPVLARCDAGILSGVVETLTYELQKNGSHAVPGFMNPEGLVVWHSAARQYFKVIFGSTGPKSLAA